jgi:hypothetical protein
MVGIPRQTTSDVSSHDSSDLTLVPTTFMIIYQWFPKFKLFFITIVIWGAFAAYIAEPVLAWLDLYSLNT